MRRARIRFSCACPVAAARHSRVWVKDRARPLSSRAMTDSCGGHALGQQLPGEFSRNARLDHSPCKVELRPQPVMRLTALRVLHPFFVEVAHFGHRSISRARFNASLISCSGVFCVFFTKTRRTTTRSPTAVRWSPGHAPRPRPSPRTGYEIPACLILGHQFAG